MKDEYIPLGYNCYILGIVKYRVSGKYFSVWRWNIFSWVRIIYKSMAIQRKGLVLQRWLCSTVHMYGECTIHNTVLLAVRPIYIHYCIKESKSKEKNNSSHYCLFHHADSQMWHWVKLVHPTENLNGRQKKPWPQPLNRVKATRQHQWLRLTNSVFVVFF